MNIYNVYVKPAAVMSWTCTR